MSLPPIDRNADEAIPRIPIKGVTRDSIVPFSADAGLLGSQTTVFVPHPPSPIKSILRCPEAGETKEGLIDQLEQIHNLVPSVLNEGIKAGIVELVDSKVGDKQLYPYQAYHLFSRKSFHPVSVLKYLWPCAHLHTPAASF